jgi:hypothetical protein
MEVNLGIMDNKILELLVEMNNELKTLKLDMTNLRSEMNTEFWSMKSEVSEFKSEMHNRFDTVNAKLEGIGGQFE